MIIELKEYEIFKTYVLKLEIQCNLKIINFLCITLNLSDGTYNPYLEARDETIYVHAQSNHQENITKQLSISVQTISIMNFLLKQQYVIKMFKINADMNIKYNSTPQIQTTNSTRNPNIIEK